MKLLENITSYILLLSKLEQMAFGPTQIPKGHTLIFHLFIFKPLYFLHHIQCGIKEFLLLLVPFNYWIRSTFDLNISFIQKWNWACEYTMFILNRKRTYSNHHSYDSSNRSHLNSVQRFTWNSLFPNNMLEPKWYYILRDKLLISSHIWQVNSTCLLIWLLFLW